MQGPGTRILRVAGVFLAYAAIMRASMRFNAWKRPERNILTANETSLEISGIDMSIIEVGYRGNIE
nr:MAG TPA: hypothetical protein [Caudoviricetes sp.]